MHVIAYRLSVVVEKLAYLLGKEKPQACQDRELREHLSEEQIDKMIADSFPASDPPSTY